MVIVDKNYLGPTVFMYGMKLRSFSPECQPMAGLILVEDDKTRKYHDILAYSIPLDDHERKDYELDYLGVRNYLDALKVEK